LPVPTAAVERVTVSFCTCLLTIARNFGQRLPAGTRIQAISAEKELSIYKKEPWLNFYCFSIKADSDWNRDCSAWINF